VADKSSVRIEYIQHIVGAVAKPNKGKFVARMAEACNVAKWRLGETREIESWRRGTLRPVTGMGGLRRETAAIGGDGGRLDSWKEIAAYLGRGERTVQRWEREYGLPVHRMVDARGPQVFCHRWELDAWWESRAEALGGDTEAEGEDGDGPGSPPGALGAEPFPHEQRLDSWKEVANYLKRGARTVQRWEREEGLPIRRLRHDKRGSVYAFKPELDAWLASRGIPPVEPPAWRGRLAALSAPSARWARMVWGAAAVALLVVAWGTWRLLPGYLESSNSVEVTPLTALPGAERHPTFSPDGRVVAFDWDGEQQDNQDIYVKQIGSEQVVRLTRDPQRDVDPVWSPDGSLIAFLRNLDTENEEVRVVPPAGGPERKVAELFTLQSDLPRPFLAWTADSQWLVAPDKAQPGQPYRLTLISVRTGEKRALTAPPEQTIGDSAAAVSRDGRELAFVRCRALGVCGLFCGPLTPELTPISAPVRLTADSRILYSPMWVDGGRALLFSKAVGDVPSLWRVERKGGGAPRLVLSRIGYHAAMSAQGDKLAYSDFLLRRNIYRIDLEEARAGRVLPVRTTNSTRTDLGPDVAPDGKKLVFLSTRGDAPELWVSRADGSEPRQLTAAGDSMPTAARWSPDGKRIAFEMGAAGSADVYTVDADGGALRRLTSDPSNECVPSWSRDGRWIYFSSDRTGRPEIWKMPAEGGAAIQITRAGGAAAIESVDGKTLYFAKASGYRKTSLLQVPVEGGEETEIISRLWSRYNFAVTADGIYLTGSESGRYSQTILFYRFATRQLETVVETRQSVAVGLTLWPPAHPRFLWYTAQEKLAADLMLVRNLRPGGD